MKTVRTPFFIDDDNNLTLHVSAGNNIWKPIDNRQKINIKEINNEITDEINYEIEIEGVPVVALFDGPHHYISPSWYHSVCIFLYIYIFIIIIYYLLLFICYYYLFIIYIYNWYFLIYI